jgi:hypothetical protein
VGSKSILTAHGSEIRALSLPLINKPAGRLIAARVFVAICGQTGGIGGSETQQPACRISHVEDLRVFELGEGNVPHRLVGPFNILEIDTPEVQGSKP